MALYGPITPFYEFDFFPFRPCDPVKEGDCQVCDGAIFEAWERMTFGGVMIENSSQRKLNAALTHVRRYDTFTTIFS